MFGKIEKAVELLEKRLTSGSVHTFAVDELKSCKIEDPALAEKWKVISRAFFSLLNFFSQLFLV